MFNQEAVDAFNIRAVVNVNNIKTMSAAELDRVKTHGNDAESLLKNKMLAMFIHECRFDIGDKLSEISGHTDACDRERIALANQLAGLNSFVDTLKQAVYLRNQVVKNQTQVSASPVDVN